MKKRIYITTLLALLIMTGCSNKLTKNNLEAYLIEHKFVEVEPIKTIELDLFESIESLEYKKDDLFINYSYSEDGAILKFYNENIVDTLIDEDKNLIKEEIDENSNIRLEYEEGLKTYILETYQKDDIYLIFNYLEKKENLDLVDELKDRYDLESGNFEEIANEEPRDYGLAISLERVLGKYDLDKYHITDDRIEVLSDFYMKKDLHNLIKNKALFIKTLAEIPLGNNINKDYDLLSANYLVINLEGTNVLIDKTGLLEENRENLINEIRSDLTEVLEMPPLDYYTYILTDKPKNKKINKPLLIENIDKLEDQIHSDYKAYLKDLEELKVDGLDLKDYISFENRLSIKKRSLEEKDQTYRLLVEYEYKDYEDLLLDLGARLRKEMEKDQDEEINLELLILTEVKESKDKYREEKLDLDLEKMDWSNPFPASLNKIREEIAKVEKVKKIEDKAREERRLEKESKERSSYSFVEPDPLLDFPLDEEIIFNKAFDYDMSGESQEIVVSDGGNKTSIYLREDDQLVLYETLGQPVEDVNFYVAKQKDRTYGIVVVNTSNFTRWSEKSQVYTIKEGQIYKSKLVKENVNIQLEEDKLLAKEWKMGNLLLGEGHKRKIYELNFNGKTKDFDLIEEYMED